MTAYSSRKAELPMLTGSIMIAAAAAGPPSVATVFPLRSTCRVSRALGLRSFPPPNQGCDAAAQLAGHGNNLACWRCHCCCDSDHYELSSSFAAGPCSASANLRRCRHAIVLSSTTLRLLSPWHASYFQLAVTAGCAVAAVRPACQSPGTCTASSELLMQAPLAGAVLTGRPTSLIPACPAECLQTLSTNRHYALRNAAARSAFTLR